MTQPLCFSSTRKGILPLQLVVITVLTLAGASAGAQTVTVQLPAAPLETEAARLGAARVAASEDVELASIQNTARTTQRALRDQVLRGAMDPAITGRNAAPVQAIALEVGKDGEAVGKATLSWRLDDYGSAVDIILKGPINQSSGVPLTDRGLASGASVNLGYNLTLWGSTVPAGTTARMAARTSGGDVSLTPLESVIATGIAIEREAARSGVRRYDPGTIHEGLNRSTARTAFNTLNAYAIARELRETGISTLNRTLTVRGSYGVGSTNFKFAEIGDAIVEKNETKGDNSAAVSVAYVQLLTDGAVNAPLMLISAGYTEGDRWKPGRTRNICTPLGATSATECRSLVDGAPTKQTEKSVEIDIRSWAYGQNLGINPHFSYDRLTKKWTSEVALSYLALKELPKPGEVPKLDSKALTVGLRVGKRPDEDGGVYAAVFFGTVLSLPR